MLEGKIAIVTGSTRGIGWAIARVFAQHGCSIVLNGRRDETALSHRLEELKTEFPREHSAYLCDVADINSVKNFYLQVLNKYKKIDVLVNNAGIMEDSLIGTITQSLIDKIYAVNVKGVINNLQYASKLMLRKKSGSIINLTSIIGTNGNTGQVVYGSSKSAVIGITLSASKELAPSGIRVNAIAPGFIETEMIKNVPKEKYDSIVNNIKMGRIGQPTDIANSALFFASDLSAYVTGQILGVDGGMLI